MANYHVLNSTKDSAKVVFHVPAPAGTNFAEKSWGDAVKERKEAAVGGPIISGVPWLEAGDPAENAQIQSGAMLEKVETIRFNAYLPNGQKAAILDARWTELSTELPDEIKDTLNFWGLDRNVT